MSDTQAGKTYKLNTTKGKPPVDATVTELRRKGRGYTVVYTTGKRELTASLSAFNARRVQ